MISKKTDLDYIISWIFAFSLECSILIFTLIGKRNTAVFFALISWTINLLYYWFDFGFTSVSFWFDSPWSPPTELYNKIQEQGLIVNAQYMEEGIGFVGEYVDGIEETYEFENESDLNDVPERLVEYWNLRDHFDNWDDEEFEEEDEDGKSNS